MTELISIKTFLFLVEKKKIAKNALAILEKLIKK